MMNSYPESQKKLDQDNEKAKKNPSKPRINPVKTQYCSLTFSRNCFYSNAGAFPNILGGVAVISP